MTAPIQNAASATPLCGSLDGAPLVISFLDPLGEDEGDDPHVALTHRQLSRLLFVAAQAAIRCEQDGSSIDPAAWLFSPNHAFAGRMPVQACHVRSQFVRAIFLLSANVESGRVAAASDKRPSKCNDHPAQRDGGISAPLPMEA